MKKPHRNQHRRWTPRGKRVWIDIESPIIGDTHVAAPMLDAQMMAYAHAAGVDHIVLYHGGDIIHHNHHALGKPWHAEIK